MSRENSNARLDNVSTKHVEINERMLRRCLESLCRNWQFTRHDSMKNILLAAIRDARKCKNMGSFKPKLQPSYTVPPRPKPRTSIVRQKTAVSRMFGEDGNEVSEYFDATNCSKVNQLPKRPQSEQNRQQTLQRSQSRPQTPKKQLQTPQKSSNKSHYSPQSAQPEQSSARQDASGTPNAFLGISRLQQGTVQTSTPFKPGTSQNKPELSFQIVLPSKHDQSQMRRIQCDHNLSVDDYERIIDIVESFTDVDNLSNSLIIVSKRNLSQIAPGKYELMKAI